MPSKTPALLLLASLFLLPHSASPQTNQDTSDLSIKKKMDEGVGRRIAAASITSLAEAEEAATAFDLYLRQRTGHGLDRATILRLAQAEWSARLQGEGTILVSSLSETATRAFLDTLGAPATGVPLGGVGTPYYVVTPENLNAARLLYARHAPQVVGSTLRQDASNLGATSTEPGVKKAYPLEALLALYVCVSEDLGYSNAALEEDWKAKHPPNTTAPSVGRKPFGDHGWAVRRPVSKLFNDELVNKVLDLAK